MGTEQSYKISIEEIIQNVQEQYAGTAISANLDEFLQKNEFDLTREIDLGVLAIAFSQPQLYHSATERYSANDLDRLSTDEFNNLNQIIGPLFDFVRGAVGMAAAFSATLPPLFEKFNELADAPTSNENSKPNAVGRIRAIQGEQGFFARIQDTNYRIKTRDDAMGLELRHNFQILVENFGNWVPAIALFPNMSTKPFVYDQNIKNFDEGQQRSGYVINLNMSVQNYIDTINGELEKQGTHYIQAYRPDQASSILFRLVEGTPPTNIKRDQLRNNKEFAAVKVKEE